MKELIAIQSKLKAPKGQYNSFGKYKYRSAEDILEAVKPLLLEQECFLTLSDRIELVGDRYYLIATATITNKDGQSISTEGQAREGDTKKGMDESQITGTASSYARKYALNGLFCIDDTKDADTDEYHNQTNKDKDYTAEAVAAMNAVKNRAEFEKTWNKYKDKVSTDQGSPFYVASKAKADQYPKK